jgi:hypothetical protein
MAKKEQKRGECIFCGGSPLSKEHIWADWLQDYIPRTFTKTAHNVSIVAESQSEKFKGKVNRPGDPHSQRLRVVCESCNNGWMSDIQNRVKENLSKLVLGQPADFSPGARLLLANWAVMFTYIWEQAEPKLITSSQEERRSFMNGLAPPPGWAVWIGSYSGSKWRGRSWRRSGYIEGLGQERVPVQSTTFTPGKIAIHTYSSLLMPVREKVFADDNHLYTIWPTAGSLLAFSAPLSDEDVDQLPQMTLQPEKYFGVDLDVSKTHLLNAITE